MKWMQLRILETKVGTVSRLFQHHEPRPQIIYFPDDAGGIWQRVLGALLNEMDGVASRSGAPLYILACTNRPDLLDPALLRPGWC